MKRKHLVIIIIFVITAIIFPANTTIIDKAVALLKKYDPIGYQVYQNTKPEFFKAFIIDGTYDYNVSIAVHECVHGISGFCIGAKNPKNDFYNYYYYMPDNTYLKIKLKSLFYRNKIAEIIKDDYNDTYYKTYLTGDSGKQDISVLLDEVNAYTYSLRNSIKTVKLMPDNMKISARDGLITFMYYLELYLYYGRTKAQKDYLKIKEDTEYLIVIKTLWENAETELYHSIPYENLSMNDQNKLSEVYSEKNLLELKKLMDGTDYTINFRKGLSKKIPANTMDPNATVISETETIVNSEDGLNSDEDDEEETDDDEEDEDDDNDEEEDGDDDENEDNDDEEEDDDDDSEYDDDYNEDEEDGDTDNEEDY